MTVDEVLSVLGQMELDLTQQIAQKRGIARMREVLTAFREASTAMETMEADKAALEEELAGVRAAVAAEWVKERQGLESQREAIRDLGTQEEAKLADLQARVAELTAVVADREQFAQERAAQLDAELTAKTAELASVTAALDAVRQKFGLAAQG